MGRPSVQGIRPTSSSVGDLVKGWGAGVRVPGASVSPVHYSTIAGSWRSGDLSRDWRIVQRARLLRPSRNASIRKALATTNSVLPS